MDLLESIELISSRLFREDEKFEELLEGLQSQVLDRTGLGRGVERAQVLEARINESEVLDGSGSTDSSVHDFVREVGEELEDSLNEFLKTPEGSALQKDLRSKRIRLHLRPVVESPQIKTLAVLPPLRSKSSGEILFLIFYDCRYVEKLINVREAFGEAWKELIGGHPLILALVHEVSERLGKDPASELVGMGVWPLIRRDEIARGLVRVLIPDLWVGNVDWVWRVFRTLTELPQERVEELFGEDVKKLQELVEKAKRDFELYALVAEIERELKGQGRPLGFAEVLSTLANRLVPHITEEGPVRLLLENELVADLKAAHLAKELGFVKSRAAFFAARFLMEKGVAASPKEFEEWFSELYAYPASDVLNPQEVEEVKRDLEQLLKQLGKTSPSSGTLPFSTEFSIYFNILRKTIEALRAAGGLKEDEKLRFLESVREELSEIPRSLPEGTKKVFEQEIDRMMRQSVEKLEGWLSLLRECWRDASLEVMEEVEKFGQVKPETLRLLAEMRTLQRYLQERDGFALAAERLLNFTKMNYSLMLRSLLPQDQEEAMGLLKSSHGEFLRLYPFIGEGLSLENLLESWKTQPHLGPRSIVEAAFEEWLKATWYFAWANMARLMPETRASYEAAKRLLETNKLEIDGLLTEVCERFVPPEQWDTIMTIVEGYLFWELLKLPPGVLELFEKRKSLVAAYLSEVLVRLFGKLGYEIRVEDKVLQLVFRVGAKELEEARTELGELVRGSSLTLDGAESEDLIRFAEQQCERRGIRVPSPKFEERVKHILSAPYLAGGAPKGSGTLRIDNLREGLDQQKQEEALDGVDKKEMTRVYVEEAVREVVTKLNGFLETPEGQRFVKLGAPRRILVKKVKATSKLDTIGIIVLKRTPEEVVCGIYYNPSYIRSYFLSPFRQVIEKHVSGRLVNVPILHEFAHVLIEEENIPQIANSLASKLDARHLALLLLYDATLGNWEGMLDKVRITTGSEEAVRVVEADLKELLEEVRKLPKPLDMREVGDLLLLDGSERALLKTIMLLLPRRLFPTKDLLKVLGRIAGKLQPRLGKKGCKRLSSKLDAVIDLIAAKLAPQLGLFASREAYLAANSICKLRSRRLLLHPSRELLTEWGPFEFLTRRDLEKVLQVLERLAADVKETMRRDTVALDGADGATDLVRKYLSRILSRFDQRLRLVAKMLGVKEEVLRDKLEAKVSKILSLAERAPIADRDRVVRHLLMPKGQAAILRIVCEEAGLPIPRVKELAGIFGVYQTSVSACEKFLRVFPTAISEAERILAEKARELGVELADLREAVRKLGGICARRERKTLTEVFVAKPAEAEELERKLEAYAEEALKRLKSSIALDGAGAPESQALPLTPRLIGEVLAGIGFDQGFCDYLGRQKLEEYEFQSVNSSCEHWPNRDEIVIRVGVEGLRNVPPEEQHFFLTVIRLHELTDGAMRAYSNYLGHKLCGSAQSVQHITTVDEIREGVSWALVPRIAGGLLKLGIKPPLGPVIERISRSKGSELMVLTAKELGLRLCEEDLKLCEEIEKNPEEAFQRLREPKLIGSLPIQPLRSSEQVEAAFRIIRRAEGKGKLPPAAERVVLEALLSLLYCFITNPELRGPVGEILREAAKLPRVRELVASRLHQLKTLQAA